LSNSTISWGIKNRGIKAEIRIKLKKKYPIDPKIGTRALITEIRISAGVIIRKKTTIDESGIKNNELRLLRILLCFE
jgi:hypothetical protein